MSGAHVDEWWPQDGPSRNGRMAWPPYEGTHRRLPDPTPVRLLPMPSSSSHWEPMDDPYAQPAQPVKDVWSGNAETDKFWAKNEPVNENMD